MNRLHRTRQRIVASLLTTATLIAASGAGCPPSACVDSTGTGVAGLCNPDQILARSEVASAVQQARSLGFSLNLETGLSPPRIEGTYDLAGNHIYPDTSTIVPGTWTWKNQTTDNHIATTYAEQTQSGQGPQGEIIRGSGNRFTVYSIFSVSQQTGGGAVCTAADAVTLVDGTKDNNGNVTGVYFIAHLNDQQQCDFGKLTIGQISLTSGGGSQSSGLLVRADFGSSTISATNCQVTPTDAAFNTVEQQNNWRLTNPGTSKVAVSFNLSSAVTTTHLRITHLSSASSNCPGGGFSPIDIVISGSVWKSNYDVAAAHGGTHGWVTDDWQISLPSGPSTIEIRYRTNACTQYWIQRLDVTSGS